MNDQKGYYVRRFPIDRPHGINPQVVLTVCARCGAVVIDHLKHDTWHTTTTNGAS